MAEKRNYVNYHQCSCFFWRVVVYECSCLFWPNLFTEPPHLTEPSRTHLGSFPHFTRFSQRSQHTYQAFNVSTKPSIQCTYRPTESTALGNGTGCCIMAVWQDQLFGLIVTVCITKIRFTLAVVTRGRAWRSRGMFLL